MTYGAFMTRNQNPQTVLVTGASSGLGAEFARQLGAQGAHLVLVARREDRLNTLADELRSRHGVTVTTLARDLGTPDAGRSLREELEERDIHFTGLVNNAGFGLHAPFATEDPQRVQEMLALNVNALVDMSLAFITTLTERRGFLINVASVLGYQPTPYLSVYGASKAFVLSFIESLWEEARGSGLRVLAVSPGAMRTEFFDSAGSQTADYGTRRATPEDVVSASLRQLRRRSAPPSVITNGRLLTVVARLLSRRTMVRFMGALQRRAAPAS